jgi:hypothetical protein
VTSWKRGNSQCCSAYRRKQRDFQQPLPCIRKPAHAKRPNNNGGGIETSGGFAHASRNEAMISGSETGEIGDQEPHCECRLRSASQRPKEISLPANFVCCSPKEAAMAVSQ